MENEGYDPMRWLNDRGYDAWILEYTVAGSSSIRPIYPKPQEEALEAVRQIRAQDRVRILGIWGWSAGGHLAAVTATSPAAALDFAILAYPVISMEPGTAHMGSMRNLIGEDAQPEIRHQMSAQTRVTSETPPTFIFHTANDDSVSVQNSLLFAASMAAHRCPFEILILPSGPHGVGLALNDLKTSWTEELYRWLQNHTPKP
ncbi:uncharacterized protein N7496_004098 [Penicillium cataractarum]|uniref:Peptidase S9 prolyl oligopeptidase catalytic domain-containing protein n=1 Tax=Penicillium cataractarum TaxID=2100454 RepID=A0A9W9VJG2_9EURO|nr:uncharacterized protein N7496_004098 [Penicillium cataractarum]KAJ5381670.1 hypothetical protein N7496_004098 [Penicillium cataractarum]